MAGPAAARGSVVSHPAVSLRSFEPTDVADVHRWFNDKEATRTLVVQRREFSLKEAEGWVRRARNGEEDRKYAILVGDGEEPVGFTALYGLRRESGPELGALIGTGDRYRGVGRWAEALTIDKAFKEFGAHRVYGEIPDFNEPAKQVVTALGWRFDELLPDHGDRDGVLFDCELWSVMPSDFYAAIEGLDLG